MKNIIHLTCLILISTLAFGQKQFPSNYPPGTYMPGRVIFKLLPAHRSVLKVEGDQDRRYFLTEPYMQNFCASQGAYEVKLLFPHHLGRKVKTVDLSLIGEFIFEESVNVPQLCIQLMRTGFFEYVEPRMIHKASGFELEISPDNIMGVLDMLYMPNDTLAFQQWHLGKIKAFDAWDIEKGDTSIIIGIVDTGIDTTHEDLKESIALNYADPINGIDDDQNGFVDDFYGWDFYYNDNDPKPYSYHGTAVAGAAAATTDNFIGVAAPGFNSRVLSVKCSGDVNNLGMAFTYEGMIYAAERGCKIINCSFGGVFIEQLGYDVVNYITFEKEALVVSIAHNYDNEVLRYPGSILHVLNVAATNPADKKEGYSSYSHLVDISAPSTIWSTQINSNGYFPNYSGTSFAAPLVSGAAAILAAFDPSLTPLQISERLRVTSDFIDDLNPGFEEKLGKGRLNMYRALTETQLPAVRFEDEIFTDNKHDIFATGDTISLSGTFINYLADVTDLTITISAPGQDLEIIKGTFNIGSMSTLDSIDNHDDPFLFVVGAGIDADEEVKIRLGFEAPGYSDYQYIFTTINRTSIQIDNTVLATTVNSISRIGYNTKYGDGLGLVYKDSIILECAFGMMMGHSPAHVSDAVLNNWNSPNIFSNDFGIIENVKVSPSPFADITVTSVFDDNKAWPPSLRLDIQVENHVYTNLGDPFIITAYEITNNSDEDYTNFHVGLWGLPLTYPYWQNRAEQDSMLQMGYTYHAVNKEAPYIGMQLLGHTPYQLYVAEVTDSTDYDGIDLTDGSFSTQEKFTTLTENRPSGGFLSDEGVEVNMVVSSGPFELDPGETVKVAFSILVADSLDALKLAAQDAIIQYESIVGTESVDISEMNRLKVYPNPAGDKINVDLPVAGSGDKMTLTLFDLSGKLIYQTHPKVEEGAVSITTGQLPNGMYLVQLVTDKQIHAGKFIKQ